MNQPNTESNYEKLLDDLQEVLHGQLLDDVVPALTALLGNALVEAGTDKKMFISYVVNSIDKYFERNKDEKNHL